jgi:hypothetical protein
MPADGDIGVLESTGDLTMKALAAPPSSAGQP